MSVEANNDAVDDTVPDPVEVGKKVVGSSVTVGSSVVAVGEGVDKCVGTSVGLEVGETEVGLVVRFYISSYWRIRLRNKSYVVVVSRAKERWNLMREHYVESIEIRKWNRTNGVYFELCRINELIKENIGTKSRTPK